MVQNNGQSMGSEHSAYALDFDVGPEGSKFNVAPSWVQKKAELSAIHDNEEYWKPPTRPKPPNAKSTYGRTYKWDLGLISAEWPAGRIF
ncbi:hypothetical protein AYI69_g1047 [Smittium culicis]|uniref:Uncharacterized protein n=1 Tax=Smittium culicis TaxID=133412 RepID=A0A1R1YRD4_9FUNG|nr:hypothetical protein AYI69_g1047 [Smittium culicis]